MELRVKFALASGSVPERKKRSSLVELTTAGSMLKFRNKFSLTMTTLLSKQFRQGVYTILGNAKDALFDLMDSVTQCLLIRGTIVSPVFGRQWSSIYEALSDSKPPREALMRLYIEQLPQTDKSLAGDHTACPRLEARTLKERTYDRPTNVKGKTRDSGTRL